MERFDEHGRAASLLQEYTITADGKVLYQGDDSDRAYKIFRNAVDNLEYLDISQAIHRTIVPRPPLKRGDEDDFRKFSHLAL